MKKYSKRLLALLLACIMVLACGVTAFAIDIPNATENCKTLSPNTWRTAFEFTDQAQENGIYTVSKVTLPCTGTLSISMATLDGEPKMDDYGFGAIGLSICNTKPSYEDVYFSRYSGSYKILGFGGKSVVTHTLTMKRGTYYLASDLELKFKYTFKPAKTAVSSAKNTSSKAAKVKWKKVSGVTGYQIQYSTKSDFSSKKTVTVKKDSTTSKKIESLKKGKKYYVRVRSYTTVNGTKCYSEWSAKKTVKITK